MNNEEINASVPAVLDSEEHFDAVSEGQSGELVDTSEFEKTIPAKDYEPILEPTSRKPIIPTGIPENSQTGLVRVKKTFDFDIGVLNQWENISLSDIEQAVRHGPEIVRKNLPRDKERPFPISIFSFTLPNGGTIQRDWLIWSKSQKALYCFPCRLFGKIKGATRSAFASPNGYTGDTSSAWRKLYERVPHHENSVDHKNCYIDWKEMESRITNEDTLDKFLLKEINKEVDYWRQILKRIIDVILFLGERGLALRGNSHLLGDPYNGNFLGRYI